jgi:oligopeptide transport system ATP-binding protein
VTDNKHEQLHVPADVKPMYDENGREILVDVKHLEVTFHNNRKHRFRAVKDANFRIYKGETFALVGESGSGKTTIARSIIRLNETSDGEILFKGKKINTRLSKEDRQWVVRNIQMIFQDPAASLNERATIDYCISEGLYNFHLYKDEEDRERKVDEALRSVGLLPEHKSRYPHEFSGGQRQRVGIARAMVMDPEFIIADEPISALDVSIRAQVLNLMNQFKKEHNLTYMFIAHDLSVVRYFADRIAVIHNGRIVEVAPSDELFRYPLHPYTHSLLQAVPMPDPEIEKAKQIVIYDESKRDLSGEKPKLREIRPGHYVFMNDREKAEYEKKLEEMEKEPIIE